MTRAAFHVYPMIRRTSPTSLLVKVTRYCPVFTIQEQSALWACGEAGRAPGSEATPTRLRLRFRTVEDCDRAAACVGELLRRFRS